MTAPLVLPDPAELALRLGTLGVPHRAVETVLGHARSLEADRLAHLASCAAVLRAARTQPLDVPLALPEGPASGLDHVIGFATQLPELRAHHAALGIPAEVTARTVADVGRHVEVFHSRYGTAGFDKEWWIARHFASRLFQLGRLQFERVDMTLVDPALPDGASGPAAPVTAGPVLSLHIPRFLGPMTPAACDTAIALAHDFFAGHFPSEQPPIAVCRSWLLDPELAAALPGSNIAAFGARFTPWGPTTRSDDVAVEFTFAAPDLPREQLPRRTSLERAVLDRLDAGGHWHTAGGWFAW